MTELGVLISATRFTSAKSTDTNHEYRESFDDEALKVGKGLKVWNVKDRVEEIWDILRPSLEDILYNSSDPHLQSSNGRPNPIWSLKCFMVGKSQGRASPIVAVCCKEPWLGKRIIRAIKKSQILQCGRFEHFGISVLVYDTAQQGLFDMLSLPEFLRVLEGMDIVGEINGNDLTMCGVGITAQERSRKATLGGIVKVGKVYFGMTVMHIFNPNVPSNSPCLQSEGQENQGSEDLEFSASEEDTGDEDSIPTVLHADLSRSSAMGCYRMTGMSFQRDPISDIPPTPEPDQRETQTMHLGQFCTMSEEYQRDASYLSTLDWALVALSDQELHRYNLIRAPMDGRAHLRPRKVFRQRPPKTTSVVLQTSHETLLGFTIGSSVSLKSPTSKVFQTVWTISVQNIQPGDCGSWAFETSTGDLIGMLIAASHELNEAYLLPAYMIFDEIESLSGLSIALPDDDVHIAQSLSRSQEEITAMQRTTQMQSSQKSNEAAQAQSSALPTVEAIQKTSGAIGRNNTDFSSVHFKKKIGDILRASGGHSCAFYAETYVEGETTIGNGALELSPDGTYREIAVHTLFGCGSFQKQLFINLAFAKIMDGKLVNDPKKRRVLHNAWNRPAIVVLNALRELDGVKVLVEEEGYMATVLEVLTHTNAYKSDEKRVFGPDGRVIIDTKSFPRLLSLPDVATHPGDEVIYQDNNYNSILVAMIICQATGLSLSVALEELVLKDEQGRITLKNTILSEENFEFNRNAMASPHVIMPEETVQIPLSSYSRDDAELAVGGGYSCVDDIAKLLRFYLKAIVERTEPIIKRFFESEVTFEIDGAVCRSVLAGLRAPLGSKAAVNESAEKVLGKSHYPLARKGGKSVEVIMQAGMTNGYSCCYYIVPKARLFVIVMTNSSGVIDPSFHISQYILQELLNLDQVVDIEKEASRSLSNQRHFAKVYTAGLLRPIAFDTEEVKGLPGVYVDETMQITITHAGSDQLNVKFGNHLVAWKSTTALRLIKIAKSVLAVAPVPEETAVDFYVAWRDFALLIEWGGDVVRFLRQVSATAATTGFVDSGTRHSWLFTRLSLHGD